MTVAASGDELALVIRAEAEDGGVVTPSIGVDVGGWGSLRAWRTGRHSPTSSAS